MAFQQYNVYDGLTACRLVATTNQTGTYFNGPLNNGVGATFTYATGVLTIDSVVVNIGDSIALIAQTSAWQNGIYICTQQGAVGVSAVLQRRADFQCIEQLKIGQFVTIGAGTVSAGSEFVLVEPLPAQFGISNLVFTAMIPAGLGTGSTKAASDNAQPSVSSVVGATVLGNLASFADTAGSVTDSGLNLHYASVAITAAEFNGMYAAPKLLIAAPGANKLIVIHKMDLVMTFVSAAYAAGGVVAAQYDSTVHGAGVLATNSEAAADFFAAASTTFSFISNSGNTVGLMPFTTSVNKGIYLSNLTGAFTTGDSTWKANIFYSVIPTV